jgi:hypothetical protein
MNVKERQALGIYFVTGQRYFKTHFSNRRLSCTATLPTTGTDQ